MDGTTFLPGCHALRPDVWKQAHPEAVRIYRVEARQARADAKAVKRPRRRIAKRG